MSDTTNQLVTLSVPENEVRYLGRVKWFRNKSGYGFITVTSTDGEHQNEDIFVHQSKILTHDTTKYRTLKTGEYVEFTIEPLEDDSQHKYHAVNVTGPGRNLLMCETNPQTRRRRFKTNYQQPVFFPGQMMQQGFTTVTPHRQYKSNRGRGNRKPRQTNNETQQ